MKKILAIILCVSFLVAAKPSDSIGDALGAAMFGTLATVGYVQATKASPKSVRVYINVTATIMAVSAIVRAVRAPLEWNKP